MDLTRVGLHKIDVSNTSFAFFQTLNPYVDYLKCNFSATYINFDTYVSKNPKIKLQLFSSFIVLYNSLKIFQNFCLITQNLLKAQ